MNMAKPPQPPPADHVAGLAGSADSGQPGAPPHAWFIGYAPAAAPRYAVVVIVEHGEHGSDIAPIFRELLISWFDIDTSQPVDAEEVQ